MLGTTGAGRQFRVRNLRHVGGSAERAERQDGENDGGAAAPAAMAAPGLRIGSWVS